MNRKVLLIAAMLLLATPAMARAQAPVAPPPQSSTPNVAIERGSMVKIEYTLTDDGGALLDTNKGQEPLTYTQGEQQVIPGLERALIGMHAGEQKKVVIKPEDGYGAANPAAQAEVPKSMVPAEMLKVGARLLARDSSGDARPVMVKEIRESTVVLDLNHPLAGKTLHFDVKVVGVDPPKGSDAKPGN